MKLIIKSIFLFSCLYSASAFAQLADLELSNKLMEITSYGSKQSFTVAELQEIETLVQRFSDDSIKDIWTANVVTFSLLGNLPNKPSRANCEIANRNINKLKDDNLKSIWVMNYDLYGC